MKCCKNYKKKKQKRKDYRSVDNLSDWNAFEKEVFRLVNLERLKVNKAPIKPDLNLHHLARRRAKIDFVGKTQISHADGEGSKAYYDKISALGMRSPLENLAGKIDEPSQVVHAWMHSKGHRDLILSPLTQLVGVGLGECAIGPVVVLFRAR